jgi:hypothetical protein
MARTKSIVLPVIHKSARTGREIFLGVKVYNSRELARAHLTPREREKVVASLDGSKRLGYSSCGLLRLCKALDGNASGLPRKDQDAYGTNIERMAVGSGRGASWTSRGKKKATKTEEERNAAELAIDGTGLLDPRKANPDAFGASATGGMRTRRSVAKQSVDVDDINSTDVLNASTHKAVEFLENKNQATEKDASSLGLSPQTGTNMEPESDLRSKLSEVPSNISAPTPSGEPTAETSINDYLISNGGQLAQTTPPAVGGNALSSKSVATPTKASKRRSRLEVELETTGTPLIQESITTTGGLFVKTYSGDGKAWWSVPGLNKPDWAMYEREVDIRRDE